MLLIITDLLATVIRRRKEYIFAARCSNALLIKMKITITFKHRQFAMKKRETSPSVYNTLGLFDISVECHNRFYGTRRNLMLEAFKFIQSIAPTGCVLSTALGAKSESTGMDENGAFYIEWLLFDAEVIAIDNTSSCSL